VIDAPAVRVWQILCDTERYAQWNPFILELYGSLRPGQRITFKFAMLGLRAWAKGTVLTVIEGRELRWTGHLLFEWLFRAEHFHLIEPESDFRVGFRHGETFSGMLMPFVRWLLRQNGPPVYEAVNTALKQRAEAATHPAGES
jgi:hypothetical protein